MSTYLLCPRKYRYTYIDKLYKKQRRGVNVNFIFGNVIHLTCKNFYNLRSEERTAENVSKVFREEWKRSGIRPFFNTLEDERELGKKGLAMLDNFYSIFGKKMPYQTEAYMEHTEKDYKLFGRVDRVDLLQDGSLEIIDYKTGTYYELDESETEERERKTIQLKLYAYLLNGSKAKVRSGSFYYMCDNKFDTIDFTDESIKYIGEWFEEIINDIRYDKEFYTKVGSHCKFCDFYKTCQCGEKIETQQIAADNAKTEKLF